METTTTKTTMVNGIDTQALQETIGQVANDPAKGMTRWNVTTRWTGGAQSESRVKGFHIGGEFVKREFTLGVDEPLQLCGTNQFPNPQEYLLTALNACMMMGYVAVCALEGIELEDVRIESKGDIDLRGFLGIGPTVKPGYDGIEYTVYIKGNGTPEQFQKVHEIVTATSPNRFNVATAIALKSQIVVE